MAFWLYSKIFMFYFFSSLIIIPLASATPIALVVLVLKKRVSMARVSGRHSSITLFIFWPIEKSRSGRALFESVSKHCENKSFGLTRSNFITAKPIRSNPGSMASTISDCIGINVLNFVIFFVFFRKRNSCGGFPNIILFTECPSNRAGCGKLKAVLGENKFNFLGSLVAIGSQSLDDQS